MLIPPGITDTTQFDMFFFYICTFSDYFEIKIAKSKYGNTTITSSCKLFLIFSSKYHDSKTWLRMPSINLITSERPEKFITPIDYYFHFDSLENCSILRLLLYVTSSVLKILLKIFLFSTLHYRWVAHQL